jgi:hypothetical protein
MVHRVQVMTPEEIKRHEKRRVDEDEYCRKIYTFCCLVLCILTFVYLIVLTILVMVHYNELDDRKTNDLLPDNDSQSQ